MKMSVKIGPSQIMFWDIQKAVSETGEKITKSYIENFYDRDPKNRVPSQKLGPESRIKRLKKKTIKEIIHIASLEEINIK